MNGEETLRRLQSNWQCVVEEVRDAATRAGRSSDAVRIVGVTKYVDLATTEALVAAGCTDLGESRPQLLCEKAANLVTTAPVRWHLIGPLQRNKVRRTLQAAAVIHSIDNLKLLRYLDIIAGELGTAPKVLIEVNISGDSSKHGFAPDAVLREAQTLCELQHVKPIGLMGMAGFDSDPAQAQREFASLRELRDRLAQLSGLRLPELSMGMSGDFVQAIAEGSTMVRIGSRLFAGLPTSAAPADG